MTQDSVSKEIWNEFMSAWETSPDSEVIFQVRSALNAIAPRLRAEGMLEAANMAVDNWDTRLYVKLLARAQELGQK